MDVRGRPRAIGQADPRGRRDREAGHSSRDEHECQTMYVTNTAVTTCFVSPSSGATAIVPSAMARLPATKP